MLRQALGGIACILCIAIHATVMALVVRVANAIPATRRERAPFLMIATMIATVSILMLAHVAEVVVWSLTYGIVDAAPAGADLVYFAFVNYTTLGYGDVIPAERWRLLGPATAMCGVLMFGWSTAVIFEVLRKARRQTAWPERGGTSG
jgi:disulfide bond formation protein DsbB